MFPSLYEHQYLISVHNFNYLESNPLDGKGNKKKTTDEVSPGKTSNKTRKGFFYGVLEKIKGNSIFPI